MNKHMRKLMSVFMAICLFCSFGTFTAFAAETEQAPIVIGEFDGLLSDYWKDYCRSGNYSCRNHYSAGYWWSWRKYPQWLVAIRGCASVTSSLSF